MKNRKYKFSALTLVFTAVAFSYASAIKAGGWGTSDQLGHESLPQTVFSLISDNYVEGMTEFDKNIDASTAVCMSGNLYTGLTDWVNSIKPYHIKQYLQQDSLIPFIESVNSEVDVAKVSTAELKVLLVKLLPSLMDQTGPITGGAARYSETKVDLSEAEIHCLRQAISYQNSST